MAAMKLSKERPPAKLRMQELRDLNQVELTEDDREKRYKEANALPKARNPPGFDLLVAACCRCAAAGGCVHTTVPCYRSVC